METSTDTSRFDELMERAEITRESGDILSAVTLFQQALSYAVYYAQKSRARCQLGLCFEHQDKFELAHDLYMQALDEANIADDDAERARAYAHLASIELKLNKPSDAHKFAAMAMASAIRVLPPMEDKVWIDHQLIKSLYAAKIERSMIRRFIRTEFRDLVYAFKTARGPLRKKRLGVWLTGYLLDAGMSLPPLSCALLLAIPVIALVCGLGLRQKQMQKRAGIF